MAPAFSASSSKTAAAAKARPAAPARTARPPKKDCHPPFNASNRLSVDLALQGGGSHGAFTWGVLDRLLEEDWIEIEAISGTSAGAMNAAVMADGFAQGGAEGGRAALEKFWRKISQASRFSPLQRGPLDILLGNWSLENSPFFQLMDMTARVFSPYQLNPMGGNPLSDILNEMVDFDRLTHGDIKLFVTATNVQTGCGRVFRNADITEDVLLASACLPMLYHAVEIDGEPYWDGGYSGNPAIAPLVRECAAKDTILVQINPVERQGTPKSAREIANRLNEVSFNSVLLKELRMIAFLRRVVSAEDEEGARWSDMRMHRIAGDVMLDLDSSSKMNGEWAFLEMLRDEGRKSCDAFLDQHKSDLGIRPSMDIDAMLPEI
ncbi:patatin-like phospholipase family protein [Thalassospira marina]|uniref:Alpha/beta hydrolase n=1 Tax=Thalassospira marina TaxID=2048283 RepID=A0ABN5FE16_9PROT|nr:patatin-like phospholipase family protein [Thalassospira marina]AUG52520.1 alpha/beta hydrolase [Thalassospira marina]